MSNSPRESPASSGQNLVRTRHITCSRAPRARGGACERTRCTAIRVALGLEAAMAAFMVDAAVYSMMGLHWFYTMVALNLLLHRMTVGQFKQAPRVRAPSVQRSTRLQTS